MRNISFIITVFCLTTAINAQVRFEDYFVEKSMRFD